MQKNRRISISWATKKIETILSLNPPSPWTSHFSRAFWKH